MLWPQVGQSVVVCFLIGRRQVAASTLAVLDSEAAEFRDLLFLPVTDGCVNMVSIGKAHAFWTRAAQLMRPQLHSSVQPLRHVGKVDDDSFVNAPLLLEILDRLHCWQRLYFGAFGFTGYQPRGFQNCGFAWGGGGSYAKYGCAQAGAHPPFPFAFGQLQILSGALVRALARSSDAAEFAAAAEALPNLQTNEDSALGLWLTRLRHVGYVTLSASSWHNLGCFPSSGMYRQPNNATLVAHRLITLEAMRYVWRVMHDGEPADALQCTNAMIRGSNKPGPLSRLRGWCKRCTSSNATQYHGSAPHGCGDVAGNRLRSALLRGSCVHHQLLPPLPPPPPRPQARSRRTRRNPARASDGG